MGWRHVARGSGPWMFFGSMIPLWVIYPYLDGTPWERVVEMKWTVLFCGIVAVWCLAPYLLPKREGDE